MAADLLQVPQGPIAEASDLFARLTTRDDFEEFLTVPGYQLLS